MTDIYEQQLVRRDAARTYFKTLPLPRIDISKGDLVEITNVHYIPHYISHMSDPYMNYVRRNLGKLLVVETVFWHELSTTWWLQLESLNYSVPCSFTELRFTT